MDWALQSHLNTVTNKQNLPTQKLVGIMAGESKEKVVEQTDEEVHVTPGHLSNKSVVGWNCVLPAKFIFKPQYLRMWPYLVFMGVIKLKRDHQGGP